jgi:hypothetical protein
MENDLDICKNCFKTRGSHHEGEVSKMLWCFPIKVGSIKDFTPMDNLTWIEYLAKKRHLVV